MEILGLELKDWMLIILAFFAIVAYIDAVITTRKSKKYNAIDSENVMSQITILVTKEHLKKMEIRACELDLEFDEYVRSLLKIKSLD